MSRSRQFANAFPMPVYASYDFIDVLELEGSPLEPAAAGAA